VTGGEELMHYTGDWYLKYAALNLAGWLLLFGILLLLANYMSPYAYTIDP
jgi:hypothetical protein